LSPVPTKKSGSHPGDYDELGLPDGVFAAERSERTCPTRCDLAASRTVQQAIVVLGRGFEVSDFDLSNVVVVGRGLEPAGLSRLLELRITRDFETRNARAAGQVAVDEPGAFGQSGLKDDAGFSDSAGHFPLAVIQRRGRTGEADSGH